MTQLPIPPVSRSAAYPVMMITNNGIIRKGKWFAEEEEYANVLIDLFDKGLVSEVENGCTLRSFLSKKLFCAPMRITKKYAGQKIGKKIFLTKPEVRHTALHSDAEVAEANEKLRAAETKFLEAIFSVSEFIWIVLTVL
jgi:hypothetical protein